MSTCHSHHDAFQLRDDRDREERLGEQDERDCEREQRASNAARGRASRSGRRRRRRGRLPTTRGGRAARTCRSGTADVDQVGEEAPARRRARRRARPAAGSAAGTGDRSVSSAESAANPPASDEPDRRRDHEAEVRGVEQDAGRRERVQREEPRRGEERERDEVHAPVAAPAGGGAGRVRERRVQPGCDEHEPEVRGLVLPVHVRRRRREQDGEPDERQREHAREEDQLRAGHSARLLLGEVGVHLAHCQRAVADRRRDALDDRGAHVAGREDAGHARLGQPARAGLGPGDDVAPLVALDLARQPLRARDAPRSGR